jgi:NAD(P)H-hydrate epimerase
VLEEDCRLEWLDAHAAGALLESRASDTHKGDYGHLLVVAGSRGKSGAAALVGRAALRSGAGLVTCAVPSSTLTSVAAHQAELMTEPLPETHGGSLGRTAGPRALRLLEGRDALAVGPGLGEGKETATAVLALLKRRQVPAVADADALNVLSAQSRLTPASLNSRRQPLVLTPHPGEASRLLRRPTPRIQADRLDAARTLARRTGAVVVLKGHRSLIAAPDGRVAVNASGNPGMATAGTGDALTGALGALLARGMTAWDAARLAVFVHGDAGDRAAAERGDDGLIAGDLLDKIPEAMLSLASLRAQRDW